MTVSLFPPLEAQGGPVRIVWFVPQATVGKILVQRVRIMVRIGFHVLVFGSVEGFILVCDAPDHEFSSFPDALSVLQASHIAPFFSKLTVEEVPVRA